MSIVRAVRFLPIFALLPLAWTVSATAAGEARPTGTKQLVVEGRAGQPRLQVEVVGNEIVARACSQNPCPPSAKAERIGVENGAEITLRALSISADRQVVWAQGPGFDALLAAGAGGPASPKVLWAGATGFLEGVPGARKGPLVQVTEPAEDGTVRVLLGEQREDMSLCGRATILMPRLLDPADLAWKPVRLQRLSPSERNAARKLEAKRADRVPASAAPVLRARIATSAVGDPGALTDGDLETTWAEGRKGSGWGELVQLDVAKDVPITGLSFVLRPPKRKVPNGAAPDRFWLATDDALYSIALPANAWSKPGASYEVSFDPPLSSECMAIVLDEAQGPQRDEIEVTFAEIIARTPLDDAGHPEVLVAELAGGGPSALAARTLLQRGGEEAFVATAARFGDLDDVGRGLALEVLDVAPCRISAPVYVRAAISELEGRAHHARDRLLRCGAEAAPALLMAMAEGPDPARRLGAELLSLNAPELAVAAIVDALPEAKPRMRAELRAALARAVQAPRSTETVRRLLQNEEVPRPALLALLRSLSSSRPELLAEAEAAYQRAQGPDPDFRTRYLLMETTARLAGAGASGPLDELRRTLLYDEDRYLRMRAAEVAAHVPSLHADLVGATKDPEPRVRLAAVMALAGQAQRNRVGDGALEAVLERLRSDAWTFVRARAADALTAFPPSEATDQALGQALADELPQVRARAVEAIRKRKAVSQAPLLRSRLSDRREWVDVRARAARALGELCDASVSDELVRLAREGGQAMATADSQVLAMASLAALGRLQPADLGKKLAPLFGEGTPHALQMAARSALANREGCR